MSVRELDERQAGLTRSQTINSLTVIFVAVLMMGIGLLMRNNVITATVPFLDEENGIRAQLPANWLVTTDNPGFIFRAEDPETIPFKTLLQVSLVPVGEGANPRNVADLLTLQRNGRLSTYRVLSIVPTTLGDSEALEVTYAYVQTDSNPFLNASPIVVLGRDVVVLRESQAIVLTYREQDSRFDENEIIFDNFLDTLEF